MAKILIISILILAFITLTIISCVLVELDSDSTLNGLLIDDDIVNKGDKMLHIKLKYIRDIKPIEFFDDGDWIDLRAGIDITLKAGGSCIVPLGVAMELPTGYSAIIAPRSSTFKKWGIIQTNSFGVIDESYCGDNDEWGLPVFALRDTHIHKNDRICQFRLIKQSDYLDFEVVKTLGNPDRNGFGSTGEN